MPGNFFYDLFTLKIEIMKAVANQIEHKKYIEPFHFSIDETHDKVEIVDYSEDNGDVAITLFSLMFIEDNFRFFLDGNKLVIVVTEKVQSTSGDMPIMDWYRFNTVNHERLRNVSIFLPGDNFYLLRHFLIPEKYLLKIFLGQVTDN